MFNNSSHVSISGGRFTNITRPNGRKDLLRERMAPGAFHNSSERYDSPRCHPKTRVAVIQEIMDWIEDDQKTTFIKWVNGPAGAGKSAISQEIAGLCHESGCLAASFFWSRSAAGRNNKDRLVASLAYQLVISIPQIRDRVEEAVETDPSFFTRSLEAQIESLIIRPLETLSVDYLQIPVDSGGPKVIILDGLDECGTPADQQYILRVISNSIPKFPIPLFFLIASRPEQAIRNSFHNAPLLDITARLTLDDKYSPDDDIRLFLVESFASVKRTHMLRSLLPDAWPASKDIDQLVQKSSGQFIYAATVMKFITSARRRPGEQLNIILGMAAVGNDTPFAELDVLYCHIFSMVEDLPKALEVLSCFFLMKGLGPSSEVAHQIQMILSFSPGELQLVLVDLHSVLNVPAIGGSGDILRVLHASLQDFLMDPARSGTLFIDQGKAHAQITRRFLQYIRKFCQGTDHRYRCYIDVCFNLAYHCTNSFPTRELLADFFDFDFRQWGARVNGFHKENPLASTNRRQITELYTWFREQLHFGRSLYAHHSGVVQVD
ncbi:hypothetical protein GALMADRAFT_1302261 [Galerina marginata CBS 339.88]|uniref:Nephrocystin 3-like N-terminal domain-containing protein n=1 Tax=Galerina marginata (strain CBS 339.88) TaxID=685588 RepID=A0A067T6Z0_GALM3|nr:hypothetical protein GALMADRAFT_1302261 [Galerina marginata CBS 339.88]